MIYNLLKVLATRRRDRSSTRPSTRPRRPVLETMEDRKLLTLMMVSSAKVLEADLGRATAKFTVSLNAPSKAPVTVNYKTSNMTGKAGVDYLATSGSVSFSPGQSSKTISVPVINNTIPQPNRTFKLSLSSAKNASIVSAAGTGTILDDDQKVTPMLSIDDPRINEGTSGTKQMIFTVSLNTPVQNKTVTVTVFTTNGTAKAGSDYQAKRQVLRFAPGETIKRFSVTIYSDKVSEGPELLFAQMTGANIGVKKANGGGWLFNGNSR
jgi:hypothetical protein